MFSFFGSWGVPVRYLNRAGNGRAVSVYVPRFFSNELLLQFSRKIEGGDTESGKLVPIALEEIKRRGGKRELTFRISEESAKALYEALGRALKDVKKRRIVDRILDTVHQYIDMQIFRTIFG